MNAEIIVKNLAEKLGKEEVFRQQENYFITAESKDGTPCIEDINEDGYTAYRYTYTSVGDVLRKLLKEAGNGEEYTEGVTMDLLQLVTNSEPTAAASELCKGVVTICNYVYENNKTMWELIHAYTVAEDNEVDEHLLIPVRLLIFLTQGAKEDIEMFREDLRRYFKKELEFAESMNKI